MSDNVARARAIRAGNRGVMTKLSKEAEELLATGQNQIIKDQSCQKRLRVIAELLGEKLTLVKSLDDEINTKCEVADIENEIEESDIINSRVMEVRRAILEATSQRVCSNDKEFVPNNDNVSAVENTGNTNGDMMEAPSSDIDENLADPIIEIQPDATIDSALHGPQPTGIPGMSATSSLHFNNNANQYNPYQTRSRLPKLVLPKFRGEVTHWQGFWDSFNSSIHSNSHLSPIDKFNHLNSLLEGQALRAIQGLTLSDANYQAAIDILHKRFGKTQHIISTHMDALLRIQPCNSERASQLRSVYDKISINVRGLQALGVDPSQYGSLLIPVIMSKLPPDVRLLVARSVRLEVWKMSELLDVILKEVEAREIRAISCRETGRQRQQL